MLTILLFLLLGAVANVAVAWGCSTWSQLKTCNSELATDAEFNVLRTVGVAECFLDSEVPRKMASMGFGVRVRRFFNFALDPNVMIWKVPEFGCESMEIRAGWPVLSLQGYEGHRVSLRRGIPDAYVPIPAVRIRETPPQKHNG